MHVPPPVVFAHEPVLVFGGPCSNLQATEAVLAEAARRGIAADRIICTGDLAAYCADAAATIDLVRASGIHVVMGNCDEQLGQRADDCACGFEPGSACEKLSSAWFAHADAQVGTEARLWLGALPRRIDLVIAGARLAVVHGSVETMNEFVFASSPAAGKDRQISLAGVDGVVGGHCGLPFTQIIDERLWHNPGIVGVPANDGTPRVWFSVLRPIEGGVAIEHCALTYDHAGAARAMRQAGLPPEYLRALTDGLWPSCDVLPYREIGERGIAIEPGHVVWRPLSPAERPTGSLGSLDRRRRRAVAAVQTWPSPRSNRRQLAARKFKDPLLTATGDARARVPLTALETLWFNTGTQCNITCRNCYIESSPRNDKLVYLTLDDTGPFLDEIERDDLGTREIGFTGGEPFLNPQMIEMADACLSRGFEVLVLTNAMRPMQRLKRRLLDLKARHAASPRDGPRLTIRVSLDHYTAVRHEEERGVGTFAPTMAGLSWLCENGFKVAVAGRTMWGEQVDHERAGYQRLFAENAIAIDAFDPAQLVLFPEMEAAVDVPEISTACWGILGKSPRDVMCATSRMVVRRKGAERATVVACTLLPYDPQFELGSSLAAASGSVPLNHSHCARFCVLGGASCATAAGARGAAEAQDRAHEQVEEARTSL